MKRFFCVVMAMIMTAALCACGETEMPEATAAPAVEVVQTPSPEPAAAETPVPVEIEEAEDWKTAYLVFLEENYDILTALWQEGMSGVGFIDLDLDETPEMVLFDFGASASLGTTIFDLADGQVVCVSSTCEEAAGAFGADYFSRNSVCANFFEDFRAVRTNAGVSFWVVSANGSEEAAWEELIRFDNIDGITAPVSLCTHYTECDPETGETIAESYEVWGEPSDAGCYTETYGDYDTGEDLEYEATGVFLWDGAYDTDCDGLLAMAEDAAEKYVPLSADYFG